ncbi:MAG: hypothetical protein EOO54_29570, partial [Haliea sp.]
MDFMRPLSPAYRRLTASGADLRQSVDELALFFSAACAHPHPGARMAPVLAGRPVPAVAGADQPGGAGAHRARTRSPSPAGSTRGLGRLLDRHPGGPPAPDAERWLLEIPYPALDRASLYTLERSGQWREQRTGDLTPVNQWPTPHRHPLLVVNFNAEEPTHYLLRIENVQGFSAPLRFVSSGNVLRGEQQVSLFLGVYFGLALLGLAVGLAGMALLRDRAYLYYAICSALIGLTQAAITGVAALHLWPDSPQWADRSLVVLGAWMMMALLVLNATIVSLAQRSRLLNRLVWAAAPGPQV